MYPEDLISSRQNISGRFCSPHVSVIHCAKQSISFQTSAETTFLNYTNLQVHAPSSFCWQINVFMMILNPSPRSKVIFKRWNNSIVRELIMWSSKFATTVTRILYYTVDVKNGHLLEKLFYQLFRFKMSVDSWLKVNRIFCIIRHMFSLRFWYAWMDWWDFLCPCLHFL